MRAMWHMDSEDVKLRISASDWSAMLMGCGQARP
ncbi:hypothetical protein HCH_04662 [Hahella chejuensis KCTC 2396]|uniref:Uncharacterized protein n=1 Tax=Hahella chejuensis (strain KCTC 2396) TaxID=349521 RepID=Q2SDB3_HAHCH|nr:hypothetical protein HCH_04662 [Hahella chejuensis KCTC 2396]